MRTGKKVIFVLVLLFSFSSIYAAYLRNVPQRLLQPDGSVLHCFASGDEFHNWLHDSAGYTIIQDVQTGYYVYAMQSGGELVASEYIAGRISPVAVGLTPNVNLSKQALEAKYDRIKQELTYPDNRQHKANAKNEGVINNLVVFIRFADEDSTAFGSLTYNTVDNMFNDSTSYETSNSMYNYYRIVSYGKMFIQSHLYPSSSNNVIVSYQDSEDRSYYQPQSTSNPNGYTSGSEYSRRSELLRNAVKFFKDSVSSGLTLDFNNDGNIDNICFIVSGYPGGWSELLWPHRSALYGGESIYINGKRAYDYNFLLAGTLNVSVMCHEMMHTLSAPDLYRYDYSATPVGSWDLMASNAPVSPQGLSAFTKYKYGGWIDTIPEITELGTYTLYRSNGTGKEKLAYKIRSNDGLSDNEYIVLEYRNTNTNMFEANLPGSGIVIYRIHEQQGVEGNGNYDGTSSFDEIYVFRPNGTLTADGNLSNAAFASDHRRTTFSSSSNPYPFYHDGSLMKNIYIDNITALGDSIQFTLKEPMPDSLSVETNEIEVDCNARSNIILRIYSNTSWTITGVNSTWQSLNRQSGNGSIGVVLGVTKNETNTARSQTLSVFTEERKIEREILIRQLSCSTGIDEAKDEVALFLFPNPVNDQLTLVCSDINTFTDVNVCSITGQSVQTSVVGKENDKLVLDVSGLSAGVYYVRLQSLTHTIVRSFVVE
ncbi:MAG: M6 family metalloprotease domain-containing protein [Bacteroidales bacterium]|jgi:M6 family metalloprotease-like protein|nr:M6 family metalloprotease domain-containing protein [Bacteroidales bacterium]